ncbi:MAG: hypothetical protein IJ302_09830 [Clostridia bacterium]|nr:hypothetical protein [Clostridia bacterium]
MKQPVKQQNSSVGSPVYVGILVFLWFMCLYIWTMVIGMWDTNGETAGGFLIVTSPFPIAAIIMLILQIRYMRQNNIPFTPLKYLKSLGRWFVRFLFPVQTRFAFDRKDHRNVTQQTEAFRREYTGFFAGAPLGQNTTQSYRNRLKLHKKRLDARGITLSTSQRRRTFEKETPVLLQRFMDGHFIHSRAREYLWGTRCYRKGKKVLYTDRKLLCADYDFIGVEKANAADGHRFRCPGCGAVSDTETLLSGCPYCAKKFLIEELSDRVCSLSLYRSPDAETQLAGLHITAFTNRLAFLAALLQAIAMGMMVFEVSAGAGFDAAELPFTIVLTVYTVLFALVMALAIYRILTAPLRVIIYWLYRTMRRDRRIAEDIAKQNRITAAAVQHGDHEFSMVSLFSGVRNKLDVLHFADTPAEVGVFSQVPLTDYLPLYRDIIDCAYDTMTLHAVTRDGDYYNAALSADMTLLFCDGTRTQTKKEHVTLTLRRLARVERKNPFGVHSPQCPNCGATVDLLMGNTCTYCGSALNFMNLDWCITSYQSSMKK